MASASKGAMWTRLTVSKQGWHEVRVSHYGPAQSPICLHTFSTLSLHISTQGGAGGCWAPAHVEGGRGIQMEPTPHWEAGVGTSKVMVTWGKPVSACLCPGASPARGNTHRPTDSCCPWSSAPQELPGIPVTCSTST